MISLLLLYIGPPQEKVVMLCGHAYHMWNMDPLGCMAQLKLPACCARPEWCIRSVPVWYLSSIRGLTGAKAPLACWRVCGDGGLVLEKFLPAEEQRKPAKLGHLPSCSSQLLSRIPLIPGQRHRPRFSTTLSLHSASLLSNREHWWMIHLKWNSIIIFG